MMNSDALSTAYAGMGMPHRSTRSNGTGASGGVLLDNPDQPSFRFGKDTDEYAFLKKLFKTNSVKASDKPADFKSRYEIFNKIKGDSFRNKFNELKKEFGVATKTGKYQRSRLPLYVRHIFLTLRVNSATRSQSHARE